MQLPFLKRKDKPSSAVITQIAESPSDNSLLEAAGEEFIKAIHSKDIKAVRESLRAIYTMIKDQDE